MKRSVILVCVGGWVGGGGGGGGVPDQQVIWILLILTYKIIETRFISWDYRYPERIIPVNRIKHYIVIVFFFKLYELVPICVLCVSGDMIFTHSGPLMPHDDTYLDQHWFRTWLVVWRHQVITCTSVDLPLVRLCGFSWEQFRSECTRYDSV